MIDFQDHYEVEYRCEVQSCLVIGKTEVFYFWQVSLDLVKSLYAKFIDWDNQMIDRESGTPAHATK